MPPKGPTKHQYSAGLSYVSATPAFLQNFGKPPPSPPRNLDREGREALPERPRDGQWAEGSDEESGAKGEEEEDEWDVDFGGGDGPQVVVLKEGRHLTADDLQRERRRGECLPSCALLFSLTTHLINTEV
jgi:hypothetical protein